MFYCHNCDHEVDQRASSCPHCHVKFTAIACPKCHFRGKSSLFYNGCPNCSYLSKDFTSQKEEISGLLTLLKRWKDSYFWIGAALLLLILALLILGLV